MVSAKEWRTQMAVRCLLEEEQKVESVSPTRRGHHSVAFFNMLRKRMQMSHYTSLNRNGDFRALYHRGKSQVHPALVTYVRKNRLGYARVGITTGKKLGGAVQRNRCRRVIRESFRELSKRIEGGWDIVFVARQRTLKSKSTYILRIMEKHLSQLKVLE